MIALGERRRKGFIPAWEVQRVWSLSDPVLWLIHGAFFTFFSAPNTGFWRDFGVVSTEIPLRIFGLGCDAEVLIHPGWEWRSEGCATAALTGRLAKQAKEPLPSEQFQALKTEGFCSHRMKLLRRGGGPPLHLQDRLQAGL